MDITIGNTFELLATGNPGELLFYHTEGDCFDYTQFLEVFSIRPDGSTESVKRFRLRAKAPCNGSLSAGSTEYESEGFPEGSTGEEMNKMLDSLCVNCTERLLTNCRFPSDWEEENCPGGRATWQVLRLPSESKDVYEMQYELICRPFHMMTENAKHLSKQQQRLFFETLAECSFGFLSGAGGWGDYLTIDCSGGFTGQYFDMNMGVGDEALGTSGTTHYCDYFGTFSNVQKIDDQHYRADAELTVEIEPDTVTVSGDTKFVATGLCAMKDARTVDFYFPEYPVSDMPEGSFSMRPQSAFGTELGKFCLYNPETKSAFYSSLSSDPGTVIRYSDDDHPAGDPLRGRAEVPWSKDLFSGSSFCYNMDLAKAAAALTAAATDREHDGYFIVPAYKALGFEEENISLFGYPNNDLNEDHVKGVDTRDNTFVFSIAMQPMDNFCLVTMILRGTMSNGEKLGDGLSVLSPADYYGHHAYRYFKRYKDDVRRGLEYFLDKHRDELAGRPVKYLISGHSLGGAAANLLAAELNHGNATGTSREDIYAFTFGALNSIRDEDHNYEMYGNIWNIFNFYDSFGPQGAFLHWVKPAHGGSTIYRKFGHLLVFQKDYTGAFVGGETFRNHVMAAYCDALHCGLPNPADNAGNYDYYRCWLSCPIDVEVYDQYGGLVGRVIDHKVEQETAKIPMMTGGENGEDIQLLIPRDGTEYTLKILAAGDGTMDFFAESFCDSGEHPGGSKTELEIPLKKGEVITCRTDGSTGADALVLEDENGEEIKGPGKVPEPVFASEEETEYAPEETEYDPQEEGPVPETGSREEEEETESNHRRPSEEPADSSFGLWVIIGAGLFLLATVILIVITAVRCRKRRQ